jgi:hypothetical protein
MNIKGRGYHKPSKRVDCDCSKCPPIHVYYKAWCERCARNHMGYKDYVKKTAEQGPSPYLAPVTAFPNKPKAINAGWIRKLREQREAGYTVRTVDLEETKAGYFQRTDVKSFCNHCRLMTHTTWNHRCRKCRAYKAKYKAVQSDYAQTAGRDGPIHEAGSQGRVGDGASDGVETLMKPCKICHSVHKRGEPCV